jgi:hypothetical protein
MDKQNEILAEISTILSSFARKDISAGNAIKKIQYILEIPISLEGNFANVPLVEVIQLVDALSVKPYIIEDLSEKDAIKYVTECEYQELDAHIV